MLLDIIVKSMSSWKRKKAMAYLSINSLEKNYIEASTKLNEIAKLENNWNNNGANSISAKLIEKCREIVMQLAAEPFICPTACGSIQFEYEKENGDYLEFEIYEDRIEVFYILHLMVNKNLIYTVFQRLIK